MDVVVQVNVPDVGVTAADGSAFTVPLAATF